MMVALTLPERLPRRKNPVVAIQTCIAFHLANNLFVFNSNHVIEPLIPDARRLGPRKALSFSPIWRSKQSAKG